MNVPSSDDPCSAPIIRGSPTFASFSRHGGGFIAPGRFSPSPSPLPASPRFAPSQPPPLSLQTPRSEIHRRPSKMNLHVRVTREVEDGEMQSPRTGDSLTARTPRALMVPGRESLDDATPTPQSGRRRKSFNRGTNSSHVPAGMSGYRSTRSGSVSLNMSQRRPSLTITPRSNQIGDSHHTHASTVPELRLTEVDDKEELDEVEEETADDTSKHRSFLTGLSSAEVDAIRSNEAFWCDPTLASKHSLQVWCHFTRHQRPAGREARYLDGSSLVAIARLTVDRFIQIVREDLVRTNLKLTSDAKIHAALIKEMPHTYMGSRCGRSVDEMKVNLVPMLRKELDRDRDGRISQNDFLLQWQPIVTQLMTLPKPQQDLCVIL